MKNFNFILQSSYYKIIFNIFLYIKLFIYKLKFNDFYKKGKSLLHSRFLSYSQSKYFNKIIEIKIQKKTKLFNNLNIKKIQILFYELN